MTQHSKFTHESYTNDSTYENESFADLDQSAIGFYAGAIYAKNLKGAIYAKNIKTMPFTDSNNL